MSKIALNEQEKKIQADLLNFVKIQIPEADLSLIDDIVLSYVVAVLDDISSDPSFDVEGFCEMMSAYYPKFGTINHTKVCEWIFDLEAKLRVQEPKNKNTVDIDISLPQIQPIIKPRSHNNSESSEAPKRIHKISELSDGGSTDSSTCEFNDEIEILQELFPSVCSLEIKHCLAIANGKLENATQILIDRQESGQSMYQTNTITLNMPKPVIDDNEVKNRIIERYSYVDKDSFNKEYRPVAPKVEPKKMIRYRDNKIVSLKGERYTEVKKGDDVEDISLKKNKNKQREQQP